MYLSETHRSQNELLSPSTYVRIWLVAQSQDEEVEDLSAELNVRYGRTITYEVGPSFQLFF